MQTKSPGRAGLYMFSGIIKLIGLEADLLQQLLIILLFINTVVRKEPPLVTSVPITNWEPPFSPLCLISKLFTVLVLKKIFQHHLGLAFTVGIAFIRHGDLHRIIKIPGNARHISGADRIHHIINSRKRVKADKQITAAVSVKNCFIGTSLIHENTPKTCQAMLNIGPKSRF